MNAPAPESRPLVIGVGNETRGDDAAGLTVARTVRSACAGVCDVVEASGEGTELLELFKGRKNVILVDATRSGAPAGTVRAIYARSRSLSSGFFRYSTHAFGVAEAVELARSLDELPRTLLIYGIEGSSYESGSGLSDEVRAAAGRVAEAVLKFLGSLAGAGHA